MAVMDSGLAQNPARDAQLRIGNDDAGWHN
jgi:hypothetical protein